MKKLSLVFIFVGIIIILIPPIGQYYTAYNQRKMIDEWLDNEEMTVEATTAPAASPKEYYKPLQEAFEEEKTSQVKEEGMSISKTSSSATKRKTPPKPSKSDTGQTILGIIRIDKLKVKLPIFEGSGTDSLRYGAGHIPGTSGIGQPGNCVLAGHRNYTFGHYFNRLDELDVGDQIMIATKKSSYKYEVYQVLVVSPEDVSVLKGSKDENVLTLITCTPIYIASHRLVIQAVLVEEVKK